MLFLWLHAQVSFPRSFPPPLSLMSPFVHKTITSVTFLSHRAETLDASHGFVADHFCKVPLLYIPSSLLMEGTGATFFFLSFLSSLHYGHWV